MASLFQYPNAAPVSAGSNYASSLLYFYQSGTTTPITTYTTSALSVPHANPVVADANGVFAPIFFNEAVNTSYRMIHHTSAAVLIKDVDNIPSLPSQANIGAALWPRTAAETSAGVTPTNYYYEPGDVRRYGAIAGSAGADTAIVQAAINQAMQSGGAPWIIPRGVTVSVQTAGSTSTPVGDALTITSACIGIIYGNISGNNNCNIINCSGSDVSITGAGTITGYGTYFQSGADNGACFKNSGNNVVFAVNVADPPQYGVFYDSSSASGGRIGPLMVSGGPTSMSGNQHYGVEFEGPWRGLVIGGIRGIANASNGRCVQGVASGSNGGNPLNVTLHDINWKDPWDHGTYCYGRQSAASNICVSGSGSTGIRFVGPAWALDNLNADNCTGGGIDLLLAKGSSLNGFSVTDYQAIGLSVELIETPVDDDMNAVAISTGVIRGKSSDADVRCGIRVLCSFGGTNTSQANITIGEIIIKDATQSATAEGAVRLEVPTGDVLSRCKLNNIIVDTCGYVGIELIGGGSGATFRDCGIDNCIVRNPGNHASASGSDTHAYRVGANATMEFGSMCGNIARDDRGTPKMVSGYSVGGAATLVMFENNQSIGHTTSPGSLLANSDYTNGDTTPSVRNRKSLHITNSGATTISNLDDGFEGQIVTLTFADANTTVDRSNAALSGGTNFVSTADDSLTLIKRGAIWIEVARAVAS